LDETDEMGRDMTVQHRDLKTRWYHVLPSIERESMFPVFFTRSNR